MSLLGWEKAIEWKNQANRIAPTLVGSFKKHRGADLGQSWASQAWAELALDGGGLADSPPINGYKGDPKLTLPMTALIQRFRISWKFAGKKTPAYRQVGNAFPPHVAKAVGKSILQALRYGE